MTDAPRPLNVRQQKFVDAYFVSGNATQSAKDAGYSEKTAYSQGHDLLKRPEIKAALAERQAEFWRSKHMGVDELMSLVGGQARNPLGSILHVTPDGDPYLDLSKASKEDLAHITEVTIEDFVDKREIDDEGNVIARDVRRVKVKLADPDKARDKLMRHFGLLKDKLEIEADASFADVFAQAMARATRGNDGQDDQG